MSNQIEMENVKLNDEMRINNDLIEKLKKQSNDQDDEIARLVTQLVAIENEKELKPRPECTDTTPCKDFDNCSWCCQNIKPCECGCGLLGGTCEEQSLLNEQERKLCLEDYYEDNGFIACEDCNNWSKPDNLFIITNNSTIRETERTICSDCFSTWWESYKLDGWKCARGV